MDFISSCRTNVHRVDNILNTRYYLYARDDEDGGWNTTHTTVAGLRIQGVLCARVGHELWIFTTSDHNITPTGFECVRNGILQDDSLHPTSSGRLVQDVLLDAIEGALSYNLARNNDTLHIGPWTWLFNHLTLRLHAQISAAGTLHTTTVTEKNMLAVVDRTHPPAGYSVVLVPTGTPAQLSQGDEDAQTVKSDTWRRNVIAMLGEEGVEVSAEEDWIRIKLSSRHANVSVTWPSRLVLYDTSTYNLSSTIATTRPWKQWFILSDEAGAYQTPLAEAGAWFMGALERNHISVENAIPSASTESKFPSTHADIEIKLAASPPFFQRNADHQAAMLGIYPTPPDGLAPSGQPSSQQPSSDNIIALGPMDSNNTGHDLSGSADTDVDGIRDQSMESLNRSTIPFQTDTDDLFGDIGEMDFAGDEVDDADFNFFDEPDDVPSADQCCENVEIAEVPRGIHEGIANDGGGRAGVRKRSGGRSATLEAPDASSSVAPLLEPLIIPAAENKTSTEDTISQAAIHTYKDKDSTPPTAIELMSPHREIEKPLSPFGIRERLLPPPIPASAKQSVDLKNPTLRRSSSFDPIVFQEGTLNLSSKYGFGGAFEPSMMAVDSGPDISLPSRRKKARRAERSKEQETEDDGSSGSESEDDLFESEDSFGEAWVSDKDMEIGLEVTESGVPLKIPWETQKLGIVGGRGGREVERWWVGQIGEAHTAAPSPWDVRKRKRISGYDPVTPLPGAFDRLRSSEEADDGKQSAGQIESLIESLVANSKNAEALLWSPPLSHHEEAAPLFDGPDKLTSVHELFKLGKMDLMYVAQLVSEQAVSCIPILLKSLVMAHEDPDFETSASSAAVQAVADQQLACLLPSAEVCDIMSLALIKEPQNRIMPNANPPRPGQPRPVHRADTMNLGPDLFTLSPPLIRVSRGQERYEMLPPALDFWEPLSLGPPSGPKDLNAFCILPANDNLQRDAKDFLHDLGSIYESGKLGSHRLGTGSGPSNNFKDGMAQVQIADAPSLESALRAYEMACTKLGQLLSAIGSLDAKSTIIVYMINPFAGAAISQYLSACFWLLYKAYRDNIPKAQRGQPRSDIVLQLLPTTLFASPHALSLLTSKQIAMLAKEVYDRSPPPYSIIREPNSVAPFIELASQPPRKINFQLTADPPSDLLYDGSILHLAYALSSDCRWVTASWINSTGSFQRTASFSLRGKMFADVAEEIWEQTCEVLATKEVLWRVFILARDRENDDSITKCWRRVVERPRKQILSITLLSAQMDSTLRLRPTAEESAKNWGLATAGFLTPATTPQAQGPSPDPMANANAPLTPAPSESLIEKDSEAHLIDLADETWGMLLPIPSPYFSAFPTTTLASGVMFQRGDFRSSSAIPAFAVSLLWTVHVRPTGYVEEGMIKHAEMTLKDVLRMYRGLGVLGRAKGIGVDGVEPVHYLAAARGAEGLVGMLG